MTEKIMDHVNYRLSSDIFMLKNIHCEFCTFQIQCHAY